jgi:hypothetical protein
MPYILLQVRIAFFIIIILIAMAKLEDQMHFNKISSNFVIAIKKKNVILT